MELKEILKNLKTQAMSAKTWHAQDNPIQFRFRVFRLLVDKRLPKLATAEKDASHQNSLDG